LACKLLVKSFVLGFKRPETLLDRLRPDANRMASCQKDGRCTVC